MLQVVYTNLLKQKKFCVYNFFKTQNFVEKIKKKQKQIKDNFFMH